jgi:hypothetical protein
VGYTIGVRELHFRSNREFRLHKIGGELGLSRIKMPNLIQALMSITTYKATPTAQWQLPLISFESRSHFCYNTSNEIATHSNSLAPMFYVSDKTELL